MNPKTTPKGLDELLRAEVRTSNSVVLKTILFSFSLTSFVCPTGQKLVFAKNVHAIIPMRCLALGYNLL